MEFATMRLVTYPDLKALFGITFTRQHILRLQNAGRFPLRRKRGNLNFWLYAEIEAWVKTLPPVTPSTPL